ncbi:MAG: hypothetical protein IJ409_04840 [Lachnospiraceae bacterium]|nr:hypothetical protein [Lachnospiraceae bacterium]
MYAIGIDIGTTSICGVLINVSDGRIIKQQTVASEAFITTENSWEKIQDVSGIISITQKILEELLRPEVLVIGLTGQMHGILYTDKEGKAISPLYTWQDERGNQPYKDTTYAAYLGSYAGYGCVTDFYNRINGLRPKEAVSFCTIQDYLGMELCGLKRPVIHTSDAASFGCFHLEEKRFCSCRTAEENGVMSTVETQHEEPEIGPEAEVTGDYRIIGEYRGIPVSVAIGDNQASVFSALADENGLLINVGTGSQITVVSDHVIAGENIESRPYVEGKYLVVGAALCGGRAYSLLKDFYKEILQAAGADTSDVYGLMEQLMDRTEISADRSVCDRLQVDTRFAGTRANPKVRGSITGIGEENFRPGNLTRGVLEGMTEELYRMYRTMQVSAKGLVGSGNGIRRNSKLVEVIEDYFGETLKIPAHKEEAAFGAALFGLVACGRFANGAEAQTLIHYEGGRA